MASLRNSSSSNLQAKSASDRPRSAGLTLSSATIVGVYHRIRISRSRNSVAISVPLRRLSRSAVRCSSSSLSSSCALTVVSSSFSDCSSSFEVSSSSLVDCSSSFIDTISSFDRPELLVAVAIRSTVAAQLGPDQADRLLELELTRGFPSRVRRRAPPRPRRRPRHSSPYSVPALYPARERLETPRPAGTSWPSLRRTEPRSTAVAPVFTAFWIASATARTSPRRVKASRSLVGSPVGWARKPSVGPW